MSFTDQLLDKLQEAKKSQKNNDKNWVSALVTGIIVLVVTGILSFIAWRRGKQIAKLKHKKALLEEEFHQAELNIQIEESKKKLEEHLVAALDAQIQIGELNVKLNKLEETHNETTRRIDELNSWDDVDDYLNR